VNLCVRIVADGCANNRRGTLFRAVRPDDQDALRRTAKQNQDHNASGGKTKTFRAETLLTGRRRPAFFAVAGKYCRASAVRRSLKSGVPGEA
jgi:hypothetical protein